MELKEKWIDLIDDHIMENLNEDSRKEFDHLFKEQEDFRKQVERQSALAEALRIQHFMDRRTKIKTIEQELLHDKDHQKELRKIQRNLDSPFSYRSWAAIAALLILAFSVGYFFSFKTNPNNSRPVVELPEVPKSPVGTLRPVLQEEIPMETFLLNRGNWVPAGNDQRINLIVRKSQDESQSYSMKLGQIILKINEIEIIVTAARDGTLSIVEFRLSPVGEGLFYIRAGRKYYQLSHDEETGRFEAVDSPLQEN